MSNWAWLSENHLSNGYESKLGLFKSLSAEECKDYAQWARDNYVCGEPINEVWHPVVQTECHLMNTEARK